MKPYVRPGKPSDADALKRLDTTLSGDPGRALSIERWLHDGSVLVAEVEQDIVGYGVIHHRFFHHGFVEMLMVAVHHRHSGVGRAIMEALERRCETPKLFVTTNLSNHPMQQLLKSMNYTPCGYIDQLDPGDPELVFVKTLR